MGSSPLARGLLGLESPIPLRGRIIPARAGFTTPRRREHPISPDHPRSRGVYWGEESSVFCVSGSSPLARGLRRGKGRKSRMWGIIPARAGFTSSQSSRGKKVGDHPRSRGVYPSVLEVLYVFAGSSPLARGLRPKYLRAGHDDGIIPARAGFTSAAHAASFGPRDHPRSRGVYHTASG